MPRVVCSTCGVATNVNERGEPSVCPECQDWLPSGQLPVAVSVPRRRPFEWGLAFRIAACVLAVLTVGPLSCLWVGFAFQPKREPASFTPTPATVEHKPAEPQVRRYQAQTFPPLAAGLFFETVELEGDASLSRSNEDRSVGLEFVAPGLMVCELKSDQLDKFPLLSTAGHHHVIVRAVCHGEPSQGVVFLNCGEVLSAH